MQCLVSNLLILGTQYTVLLKSYDEDKEFHTNNRIGYCSELEKEIVICDMATYPGWKDETLFTIRTQQKATFRHETLHAYLYESGLSYSSLQTDAWARNEEMIDWFALQGPKICETWEVADEIWKVIE